MQSHLLKRKTKRVRSKQVGRGGKRGKTSGKGTKGQNARAGRKKRPEMRDVIKRFPKLRGRGKNLNTSIQVKPTVVNLSQISGFSAGESVSPNSLVEKGIIKKMGGKLPRVKILGDGEIKVKLSFNGVSVTESAQKKIESAGGTVTN